MKHIAYGNITQRNEEKEVIIDSLKKMNCPVLSNLILTTGEKNGRSLSTSFRKVTQQSYIPFRTPLSITTI